MQAASAWDTIPYVATPPQAVRGRRTRRRAAVPPPCYLPLVFNRTEKSTRACDVELGRRVRLHDLTVAVSTPARRRPLLDIKRNALLSGPISRLAPSASAGGR